MNFEIVVKKHGKLIKNRKSKSELD